MGDEVAAMRRYAYWFPLALLGFGLLALLGWESVDADDSGFAYYPTPEYRPITEQEALLTVHYNAPRPPDWASPLRDWPWAVLVTVAVVGTVAWYGTLARRAGRSVRKHVILAVGCGIAVPVVYVIAAAADAIDDPAELVGSVGLPLVGLGALAGAWVYFRLGPWRRTAAVISVASLLAGLATMLGAVAPGLLEPVIITCGLLALAWYERSRLVGAVACAVLASLLLFPDSPLSTLIPAVLVLAAAIVALVRQHRAGAPA